MLRPVRDAQARDEGPKEANVSRLPTCQTRQLAGWPVYESEWLTARLRELKCQQRPPCTEREPPRTGRLRARARKTGIVLLKLNLPERTLAKARTVVSARANENRRPWNLNSVCPSLCRFTTSSISWKPVCRAWLCWQTAPC